ncbi:hypothetical protein KS4_21250 [Poriferisphaera corsica]|uniref:DUF4393 domain-containing protein n=1 Tax=Poriferisphaera corsica TaxID=2528020 RepID=A0A517YUY2_9BACT|nr:DUF4393 domain-containing protein [Poriferisphaera corsica]QDU34063.1 hypothetical protein KS4_21250 [Poriferisphaera corsica]
MTPGTVIEIAKALGVKEILPEVYRDLLKPTTQLAGQKLFIVANALGKAFDPLEGAVWGYDCIKDWICSKVLEKFTAEDPANIQSPKLSIAGPIMMNLHFAYEEEHLKEMYANLLAAAMHKERADSVHPSYVHVLQQLSSDEALILNSMTNQFNDGFTIRHKEDGIHQISFGVHFSSICRSIEGVDEKQACTYLDNFIRLRIFQIETVYEKDYLSMDDYNLLSDLPTDTFSELSITEFGSGLIAICI